MTHETTQAASRLYRQGDILIVEVRSIPQNAKEQKPTGNRHILAEGEVTGHHHSIGAEPGIALLAEAEGIAARRWLQIDNEGGAVLTHQEHAPITLPPGTWEVRRQREYSPQEVRRVAD